MGFIQDLRSQAQAGQRCSVFMINSISPSHIHELTDLELQLGCRFLELSDPRLLSFLLPLHGPDSLFVLQEPFSSNFLVRVCQRKRVRENERARARTCVSCAFVRQRESARVCVPLELFPCLLQSTHKCGAIYRAAATHDHDVMMIDPCHHRHQMSFVELIMKIGHQAHRYHGFFL